MMNELIDELVDECLFKILQQQGFILAIKGGKYGKEKGLPEQGKYVLLSYSPSDELLIGLSNVNLSKFYFC